MLQLLNPEQTFAPPHRQSVDSQLSPASFGRERPLPSLRTEPGFPNAPPNTGLPESDNLAPARLPRFLLKFSEIIEAVAVSLIATILALCIGLGSYLAWSYFRMWE